MTKPTDFGLPEKFEAWRPHQYENARTIAYDKERFYGLNAPTGTGKSVTYMAPFQMINEDSRMVVVTQQTSLQDQINYDFPGICDVRGQKWHECKEMPGLSCRHGIANKCGYAGGRMCSWKAQQFTMGKSDQVVTNYMAYLTYGPQMGWFDYAVFDEFHDALDTLAGFVRVHLNNRYIMSELCSNLLHPDADMGQWRAWAENRIPAAVEATTRAKIRAERNYENITDLVHSIDGERAIRSLAGSKGEWVYEHNERGITFEPVDLRPFGSLLFRKTPRIVLSSATMSKKTTRLVDIDDADLKWISVPAVFKPDRYRILYAPIIEQRKNKKGELRSHHVQWTRNSSEEDIRKILRRTIDIVGKRLDRRGIIHSVSYTRAQEIALVLGKEFGRKLVVYAPDRMNLKLGVQEFLNGPENAVIIAPSISTGYDFGYDKCRYQVVPKLPWPDVSGAILSKRCEIDPELSAQMCMTELIQMLGRGMRAEDDWCENFILDGSFSWFWRLYQDLCAPTWFPRYVEVAYRGNWNQPIDLAA